MIAIKSLIEIIHNYENYIIDQWGVMHDGIYGFDHAIEAINYLEKKNKNLFVISNSSKRKKSSEERLPHLGFKKNSFIKIITSGEVIWNTIKREYSGMKKQKKCFHIYDERKEDGLLYREGLNLIFTEKIEYADFILACTPFANLQPVDYIPILDKAIEKNLLMYCANPDFETIERNNDQNIFCMGAIADIYKKMGGEVISQGKPEVDVYLEASNSFNLDKSKTIAIGDSLFHDIKGANNFSIDSILVKSGIHKDLNNINNIIKNHQILPTYIIDNFTI